jgi:hypothetical protein
VKKVMRCENANVMRKCEKIRIASLKTYLQNGKIDRSIAFSQSHSHRITSPAQRLLVHDVITYGVPICAFYGNVTPHRSKHKLYLECSGTFASSFVSSDPN